MHLNRFEIHGREYGVNRDGGPLFRNASEVLLKDLKLRRLERFVYEYDFGDDWIHDIRLEAILAVETRKTYPVCVAGQRAAPPEDCGGPNAFMERRWQYAAIGSRESQEEWEIMSRYHPDRFDRRTINRALYTLASGSYAGALDEIHHSASH